MPPLVNCLHPITPAAAMVNEFEWNTQNTNKTEPPRADQCLGGQFACAPMSYLMFSTIVDVTNNGGCGCCVLFRRRGSVKKEFCVGINIWLPQGKVLPSTTAHNHGISDMTTSWSLMLLDSPRRPPLGTSKGTRSIHHGRCHCALVPVKNYKWAQIL